MDYIDQLLEFIFPSKEICLFCKESDLSLEGFICKSCSENINMVNREVFLNPEYIERAYYATVYDKFMKEIIKRYKFNDKSYLYKPLGYILASTMDAKDIGDGIDLISFVPSHRRKEAMRGYNQVELLARYIAKRYGIEIFKGLIKIRQTQDQHFLKEEARKDNLKSAFKVKRKEEIEDKRILLIDDILTSGATMEECAGELKKNGARSIIALALTSGRKL